MPTGIDAAVVNPLPVTLAGQLVIVYAMGSVTPSLPIVSLFPCADEQATACTAFIVHFADGDVPLAVVFGVSVPAPDGSILKDIEPLTADEQVFVMLAVTPVVAGIVALITFGALQLGQLIVSVTALLLL
jgi:hypothetical protein